MFVGPWEVQRGGGPRGCPETSRLLAELRTAQLSAFSLAPGRSSGMEVHADLLKVRGSLRGCEPRNCRHFRGLMG
eukprot:702479-Pyramimonas_sp.AAC.1